MLGIYQINRVELTPECPSRFASTSVSSINKLTAFGGTFLTILPIFAIITNSYTIELKNKATGAKRWGRGVLA